MNSFESALKSADDIIHSTFDNVTLSALDKASVKGIFDAKAMESDLDGGGKVSKFDATVSIQEKDIAFVSKRLPITVTFDNGDVEYYRISELYPSRDGEIMITLSIDSEPTNEQKSKPDIRY